MKIRKSGKQYTTILTRADEKLLDRLVDSLKPFVKIRPLGTYQHISASDIWMRLLGQLCVRGSSSHWEKASKNGETKKLLNLRVVLKQKDAASYLKKTLKQVSATRFYGKVAEDLAKILKMGTVFNDGKATLFEGLSHHQDLNAIRDELRRRCGVFGLKSASDFMISTGLSQDVIALDARVLGLFRDFLDLREPIGRIQNNRQMYLSVEAALRKYCVKKSIRLAVLDRLIYQYSGKSVVSILASNPRVKIVHSRIGN